MSTLTLSILGRLGALLALLGPHLRAPPPCHAACRLHAAPTARLRARPLTLCPRLRSSVLPVPFAFSRMGVLLGVLTMAVVAYSNSLTSVLLLRAAGLTGHDTYEGVAQAVAGPVWKASLAHLQAASTDLPLSCSPCMRLLRVEEACTAVHTCPLCPFPCQSCTMLLPPAHPMTRCHAAPAARNGC